MKLLIVGCGSIGRRHARNAAPLAEVAVVDADAGRAASVGAEATATVFPTLDAALAWRPAAAIVATPTHLHLDVARRLVAQGVDILIEKPVTHDPAGIPAFRAEITKSGRRVYVACNMRFHAGPGRLKAALPRIGRPLFLRAQFGNFLPNMRADADYRTVYSARRAMGGGVILDSIHELDYGAWLLGPVESVTSSAGRLSDLDIDVEDYAAVALHHRSGVRSEIHLDYLQRFKRRGCEIVGTEGTLVWTSEGKTPERCTIRLFTERTGWEVLFETADLDPNEGYVAMLKAFLGAVGGEPAPDLLDFAGGCHALEIAMAAHRASDTGQRQTIA